MGGKHTETKDYQIKSIPETMAIFRIKGIQNIFEGVNILFISVNGMGSQISMTGELRYCNGES